MQQRERRTMADRDSFDPRIIAFCCNWCSYAAGDLAGSMRLEYPTNVLPIRVMCSGRVSPHHVLKARLEWISSSEGAKFANIMSEFTQQIRELGPSPLGKKA
jgi:F420-non-reducing hydrogenase iron-sulfur subunit